MTKTEPPAGSAGHPAYRADIDGLRAIAVLAVVIFHAFPDWLGGGFVGVDIFFVISGFLITTIIVGSLYRASFGLVGFYQRRILRIFPALIVVMAACLLLGWAVLLPGELAQLGKHVAGGAGFVSNFVLQSEAGYFDTAGDLKPLLHLWSLGIEEQFYVVFPLLVWFVWRRGWNLAGLVGAGIVLSFALNLALIGGDPVGTFYGPLTRAWELLVGSGLALAGRLRALSLATSQRSILALVGLALIIASFMLVNEVGFPGWQALPPVLGTSLLILAGPDAWPNRTLLSLRPLVWIGLISFPLYLWHWPFLVFARIMENGPVDSGLRAAVVILAVLLSWITYCLIERPIRFSAGARGVKAIVLTLLMLMTGLSGMAVFWAGGVEHRLTGPTRSLNQIISTPYPEVDYVPCSVRLPQLDASLFDDCLIHGDGQPTILFVGDSHTKQFRSTDWSRYGDPTVLMLTRSECLPFATAQLADKGTCREAFQAVLDVMQSQASIEIVVLSGYWSYLMSAEFARSGSNWRIAMEPDADDVASFSGLFETLVETASVSGKRVVFMRDIPDLDFDVLSCFDNRPVRLTEPKLRGDCSIDQVEFERRMQPFDRVIDAVLSRHPDVVLFDTRALFCNGSRCQATNEQLPYYFNGDHLNHLGAGMVINKLWPVLEKPAKNARVSTPSE